MKIWHFSAFLPVLTFLLQSSAYVTEFEHFVPENNGVQTVHKSENVHLDRIMRLNRVDNESDDDQAKCLDGTSPVYYMRNGYGGGRNKFMIYLQGGGWCYWLEPRNNASINTSMPNNYCSLRAVTGLGSTKNDNKNMITPETGILSHSRENNPAFYNWNLVFVRYCDGGSFSGDSGKPEITISGNKIHFRGYKIFQAVISHLVKNHELGVGKKAVLTGGSAGGLATILRCDDFSELLDDVETKCVSDVGFFIDVRSVNGIDLLKNGYKEVINCTFSSLSKLEFVDFDLRTNGSKFMKIK